MAGAAKISVSRRIGVFLATGLGVGFIPWAPGTMGTLAPGMPLAIALGMAGWWAPLAGGGVVFLSGLWACPHAAAFFRRKDPPSVVIDEVAAFLLVCAGLPLRWPELLLAFVLFRAADIAKPWPAGLIDRRVPGAPGVMLDDLAAAAWARLALETLRWLLPSLSLGT